MRRVVFPAAIVAGLLAAVLAGAAPSGARAADPHAFMTDIYRCPDCHVKVPERGQEPSQELEMTKDIVTLCVGCHGQMVNNDKHPVDIRPEREIPAELPLDNYFSITCVTCHDPHGSTVSTSPMTPMSWLDRVERFARGEKTYRSYFLRRSTASGELCLTCHTRENLAASEERAVAPAGNLFTGSERCKECHAAVHKLWRGSVHARYVGDVSRNPGVVRGRFEGDTPFKKSDLLYTLGEHWTQRYVVKGTKEPMVRPEIWSIQSSQWINSGTYSRSWYRYCAGCHVTGFNPFKGTFVEIGIGCEACHGPGKQHCETTDQFDIVNPAKLTESRRDMICEACHTAGHDRSGLYRFPVGYRPGEDLMKFFRGLVPKPGQEPDTFKGDGTYEDRHRQFHYWMDNYNITQGILCDVCKNFRQTIEGGSGDIYLTSSEFCATCHPWYWKNYARHSRHSIDTAGCIDCHTPPLVSTGERYSIHDHKFQFGPPVATANLTLDERCGRCHGEPRTAASLGAVKEPK